MTPELNQALTDLLTMLPNWLWTFLVVYFAASLARG